MSVWQPIETAPRDGTVVLVFCADNIQRYGGFWDQMPPSPPGIALAVWDEYRDLQSGQSQPVGWVMASVRDPKPRAQHVALLTPTHWMPLPTAPEREQ